MGIKHFFSWFRKKHSSHIHVVKKGEILKDIEEEFVLECNIDNLMIDMNGIFHNSAQKTYQYGSHKPKLVPFGIKVVNNNTVKKQIECFNDICLTIEKVIKVVNPRKRLILCVDGPAPISKQCQQRQRRFMSAKDRESENRSFDSNMLTPGTKFMDHLTKYVDWYIKKQISENEIWNNIEVIFSNEKAPGEGEHKLLNYVRNYGNKEESYCIYGMDADLIMLSLATHFPNFFILREDQMSYSIDYYLLNIGRIREEICENMYWKSDNYGFDSISCINDFIFMCFTVGNDFLPHIPGIEIIEGGIEFMLDVYINTCENYGHITRINSKGEVKFRKESLKVFLGTLSQYEKGILENKLQHKGDFFPDIILENSAKIFEGKYELNIQSYRKEYYEKCLNYDLEKICHDYLEGMQWVLSYYTKGVPNWSWRYPYHYAPFAFDLAKHIDTFKFKKYKESTPSVPFVQLLSVLPPKSAELLPEPLNTILINKSSSLIEYYPEKFDIDVSGKRKEWEAVVLLPIIDMKKVLKEYNKLFSNISEQDKKRNILGKSFSYKRGTNSFEFKSFYGDIQNCAVSTTVINI